MPDSSVVPPWLDRSAALAWRALVVGVAVWAVLALLLDLFLLVVPVFAALIIAALLDPLARWLQRLGAGQSLAAGVAVLVGVLVVLALLAVVVMQFMGQGSRFVADIDDVRNTVVTWTQDGPLGLDQNQVDDLIDRATDQVRDNAGTILSGALGGTRLLLEGLSAALLSLVLAFFFVRDTSRMADWLVGRLTPGHRQAVVRVAVSEAYATLGSYVRGVVVIGVVNAVGVAIGLLVLGVPLVLPLSLLVFVGAFFPVIGAFVSGLVAVLVAVITQGFVTGLAILGVIVVVQQIEGHLLQPTVMGRAVPLHPAVVLVVLTAGGLLAGIAGAAMAVPTAAALSAAGHRLRIGVGNDDAAAPAAAADTQPVGVSTDGGGA